MNQANRIYEKSVAGRKGYTLPKTAGSHDEILSAIPKKYHRSKPAALPEVSEGEAMRHFIGLSVKNHHIDKGFYPLGSCTMKYNPRVNDKVASLAGYTDHHPLAPCSSASGNLQLIWDLAEQLCVRIRGNSIGFT